MRECVDTIEVPAGTINRVREMVMERGLPPAGWHYDVILRSDGEVVATGTLTRGTEYHSYGDVVLAHIENDLPNIAYSPEHYGNYDILLEAADRAGLEVPERLWGGTPERISRWLAEHDLHELDIRERFQDIWERFMESVRESLLEQILDEELSCVIEMGEGRK